MFRLTALVALAGLLAAPLHAQESDVSAEKVKEMRALAKRVAAVVESLRGKKFTRQIPVGVQTRKALGQFVQAEMKKQLSADKLAELNAHARKLGLIPKDADLGKIQQAVLTENIGGFYRPEHRKLFLVADPVPSQSASAKMQAQMLKMMGMTQDELVMAHELTHALDDQHYPTLGLDYTKLSNDDRFKAIQCAFEGVANVIMYDYMLRARGVDSRMLANQDLFGQGMKSAQAPAIDKAPRYVKADLLAPYTIGLRFVAQVRARDNWGWELANKLYTDPPQSMEQVLHPEKFFDRDVPTVVALTGLDAKFEALGYVRYGKSNTLGEFTLRELFVDHLKDQIAASTAAAGWDGDRYAIYKHGKTGALALAAVAVFDSEKDATEFVAAYRRVHAIKYPGAKATEGGVMVDPSGSHLLAQAGTRVHILESVPAAALAGLAAQLNEAKLSEAPRGLPKIPSVERVDAPGEAKADPLEGMPFTAKLPEGWTPERGWGEKLTLKAASGSTIQLATFPGDYTPELLARKVSKRLPDKLGGYRALDGKIEVLPLGAVQLHYAGTRDAALGERHYSQLFFAMGDKTVIVMLTSPAKQHAADREALARFVRTFKPKK